MNPDQESTVKEFAQEAKRYCQLVENYKNHKRDSFLKLVAQSVSYLIYLALRLSVISEFEGDDEENKLPEIKVEYMRPLTDFFGDWNYCREVFDGTVAESNPQGNVVTGSLGDDMTDIYMDLKMGLFFYDQGVPNLNMAVFQWNLLFEHHWGENATSLLRAAYWRLKEFNSES